VQLLLDAAARLLDRYFDALRSAAPAGAGVLAPAPAPAPAARITMPPSLPSGLAMIDP